MEELQKQYQRSAEAEVIEAAVVGDSVVCLAGEMTGGIAQIPGV